MRFPQYRKLKNNKSYYVIHSDHYFTEYQREANSIKRFDFEVKILPDRNYIQDMLNRPEPYWDCISKEEFEAFIMED